MIAGSKSDAIDIYGNGTDGNVVAGNFIGTDVTGTRSLGIADDGVFLAEGASSNWIGVNPNGGSAADQGNVISGNGYDGVEISDSASFNVVAGNKIGTDVTSTKALGNADSGVEIDTIGGTGAGGEHKRRLPVSIEQHIGRGPVNNNTNNTIGANNNTIGGTTAGAGNVISANQNCGILITGYGVSGNLIQGNKIGTDVTGTVALGNAFWGVELWEAAENTVGGPTAGAGNIVSGNEQGGVAIRGIDAVGDVVQGNLIGTDATGTRALGNGYSGVYVGDWGVAGDAASNATIGGTTAGAGNVISANGNDGIWITGAGTTGVVVQHNLIGTDLTGTKALENFYSAVEIDGGAANTIGGTTADAGNVISANGHQGVLITGDGATGNLIQGNEIGTDVAGTVALGNSFWSLELLQLELLQVVGNGGGGVQAHFEGSYEGLTLTSSEIYTDLPNPSALVYAGLAGVLVALSLGVEIAPPSPLPSPTPPVAQLVPLQESSLALVGTFLITTLPSSGTEVNLGLAETEVATTMSLSTIGPVAQGQSAAAQSRGEDTGASGDETPTQPEPAKAGVEPPAASWQNRVLGTDEALERFDREHPDLSRPRREDPPETNPSQGQGAIPAPAEENPPPRQGHPAAADRLLEAVDGAIDHLHDGQQTAIERQTDPTASGKETER